MKDGVVRARGHRSGADAGHLPSPRQGLHVMLDASALIKRYAVEAGHERLLALMEQADYLSVAAHCLCEVGAALLRLRREGCLVNADFERAWSAAQRDVADMGRVPVDDHVQRFAFVAMEREAMRMTDALHLASALVANVDLFVTADARVAQAARALGLPSECLDGRARDQNETLVAP